MWLALAASSPTSTTIPVIVQAGTMWVQVAFALSAISPALTAPVVLAAIA